jgi:hypothetical protein
VPTATDRAVHRSEDPENCADDDEDDPDRPQDPDPERKPEKQQNQTENDHLSPFARVRTVM